jgi:hypothetical protein
MFAEKQNTSFSPKWVFGISVRKVTEIICRKRANESDIT